MGGDIPSILFAVLHRPHLRTGPTGWMVWCPGPSNHMKAYLASPRPLANSFSSGPFTGNCPTHYICSCVIPQDEAQVAQRY